MSIGYPRSQVEACKAATLWQIPDGRRRTHAHRLCFLAILGIAAVMLLHA